MVFPQSLSLTMGYFTIHHLDGWMCMLILSLNRKIRLKTGYFSETSFNMEENSQGGQNGGGKGDVGSPTTHHQQCLHPPAQPVVPALPGQTYQNGGDDKRPVSQGICDVGRPVLVAVCHVKATVWVPNPNLHRREQVSGCLATEIWNLSLNAGRLGRVHWLWSPQKETPAVGKAGGGKQL